MAGHKVIWNGITYKSMAEAARALGISREAMRQRIAKGHTSDADLQPIREKTKARPVIWNGVHYPSMTQAAKALGITIERVKQRAENGFTSDADIKAYWKKLLDKYEPSN